MPKRDNLTGQRFGELTVTRFHGINIHGKSLWVCDCDCGNTCIARAAQLKAGKKTTCGCKTYPNYNKPEITINGETKGFNDWCKLNGIDHEKARKRVSDLNWGFEKAVTVPIGFKHKKITFDGQTRTLRQWALHLGIKYTTLRWRFRNGWSVHEAFVVPVRDKQL